MADEVADQWDMPAGHGDRMLPDGRQLTRVGRGPMGMTLVSVTRVIVGTAASLGLAILGWGGWTAFFSHPARVALAVELSLMAGVSRCTGGHLGPGLREDRGHRWVIVALALIGRLNSSLPADVDRKAGWTLDGDPMRWLGVGRLAAGGALRIGPVVVRGHWFSGLVALQPGHMLVTSGVYRPIWLHSLAIKEAGTWVQPMPFLGDRVHLLSPQQHDLPLPRTQSLLTAPYIPASAVAERFALFRLPERWDRWPTHLQVTGKATFVRRRARHLVVTLTHPT
jgi:hypothetical protein